MSFLPPNWPSTPEEARRWFDRRFTDLKCEFISPTGKVLIIDKVICIARWVRTARFIDSDRGPAVCAVAGARSGYHSRRCRDLYDRLLTRFVVQCGAGSESCAVFIVYLWCADMSKAFAAS